jgi:pyruvate dehydrogenase E2 component (dihydrolipoamide acetyltransferase)
MGGQSSKRGALMADTVTMPKLGFDMAEGTLVRWVKAEGDTVSKGDVLAEIETDKATVEVESSFSGVVFRHMVDEGSVVPVGASIAVIAAPGESPETGTPPVVDTRQAAVSPAEPSAAVSGSAEVAAPSETSTVEDQRIKASPLAKRIAREEGIPLESLAGSGPGGRIVRKDVEGALAEVKTISHTPAAPEAAPKSGPTVVLPMETWSTAAPERKDEHVPLTRLRTAIARRMVESKQAPHFYVTHEYDMAPLMKLRKEINEFLPEEQRLSVNDFIVKAVALTLRQFPNLNASFAETEIIRHGSVNVGVAVALDSGLMTVVSRDADLKPMRVISGEIKNMAARARAGKVKPDDIEGSTFSISNLGMFDVENFAAIINSPEAAILAVSSVRQVPVVMDGAVVVGTRMKATLSADHRVTDGAEAALFMQKLALYLEKPASLLI